MTLYRNNDFEILLINWDKHQGSPIHNHADNGCVLKMMKGELFEKRFDSLNKTDKPIQETHF